MKWRIIIIILILGLVVIWVIPGAFCYDLLNTCMKPETVYEDVSSIIAEERLFTWLHDSIGLNAYLSKSNNVKVSFSFPLLLLSSKGPYFYFRYTHTNGITSAWNVRTKLYIKITGPFSWNLVDMWEHI